MKSMAVGDVSLKRRMARAMKNRRGVRSVMVGKRMTRREINQRDHPLIEILNHQWPSAYDGPRAESTRCNVGYYFQKLGLCVRCFLIALMIAFSL